MIHLYQLYPDPETPDPSPFCFKVQFFLKYYDIKFTCHKINVLKAPKKKAPYIYDDETSAILCDSEDILTYLCSRFEIEPDKDLTPIQKANAYCLRKMMEEYLYFIILFSRWGDQRGWDYIEPVYFKEIPPFIRRFITPMIRRSIVKAMYGQGVGRHSHEEIYKRGEEIFPHLETILTSKKFFMGQEISMVDFTAFPFLYANLLFPYRSPLYPIISQQENLVRYVDTLANKFYPAPKFPTP